MKMKLTLVAAALAVLTLAGCAHPSSPMPKPTMTTGGPVPLSQTRGMIMNQSALVVECTQMIGGYCAHNPQVGPGNMLLLPDPGSKLMRGHIMVFNKNKPGHYVDNIVFSYQRAATGWRFKYYDLYRHVKVTMATPTALVISH